MISRLVEENEMKNNRIHKLEYELSSVSKTLDYWRKILSDKIQDWYEGNRMNSRQQFANLYHNGSKEINSEPLDFSENKSVMFSTEDHNHHSLASVLNSKMSKIPESSEGSNLNDYNEIFDVIN